MPRLAVVVMCAGLLAVACSGDDSTSTDNLLAAHGARVWVATEPVQCLTNPWEADWVQDHPGEMYPRDLNSWPRRLTDEEIDIITDYYAELGVTVFDTDTAEKSRTICAACTCEEGYTLFLLVGESDVETMIGLGYRRAAPKP